MYVREWEKRDSPRRFFEALYTVFVKLTPDLKSAKTAKTSWDYSNCFSFPWPYPIHIDPRGIPVDKHSGSRYRQILPGMSHCCCMGFLDRHSEIRGCD